MNFINKLIKRGTFCLLIAFSFFAIFCGTKTNACTSSSIELIDGDEYLVLNTLSGWSDSGVEVTCDGNDKQNVTVKVNDVVTLNSTNHGVDSTPSYLNTAGFYTIEYILTEDTEVKTTRFVRVIGEDLNDYRRVTLGNLDNANTGDVDNLTKIVEANGEYVAIGNFNGMGYLVGINYRGEVVWKDSLDSLSSSYELLDLIYAGGSTFYVSGSETSGAGMRGFVARVVLYSGTVKTIKTEDTVIKIITDSTAINKILSSSNYIVAAGYKDDAGVKKGVFAELTKTGDSSVFAVVQTSTSTDSYVETIKSTYNSMITINSGEKVLIVGNRNNSQYSGSLAGVVIECTIESGYTCSVVGEYFYSNYNGTSATTTTFNDIVEFDNYYAIVGETMIDKIGTETNKGNEDGLIVVIDSIDYSLVDTKLIGSIYSDKLVDIIEDENGELLIVGNVNNSINYLNIDVEEELITINSNKTITGNGTINVNNVLVKSFGNNEVNYVMIGKSASTTIDGIIRKTNSDSIDAVLVIVDVTEFDNYSQIDLLVGADFDANDYKLEYGTNTYSLNSATTITTASQNTFDTYYTYTNSANIKFYIGRKIVVSPTSKGADLSFGVTGIDIWQLYSRTQTVGTNPGNALRKELWSTYYEPVDDGEERKSGTTYYKLNKTTLAFEVDYSTDTTLNNYVKLSDEPQNNNVALQSEEMAKKYAYLQEYTRIAFVTSKFKANEEGGASAFYGEGVNLNKQNYYFIYYIDMNFGNESCRISDGGEIVGTCTNYTGYAFATLTKVKKVINSLLKKYNYFITEKSTTYNPTTTNLPETDGDFYENVSTEKYTKTATVSLTGNVYLYVKYYAYNNTTGLISNTSVDSDISAASYSSVKFMSNPGNDLTNYYFEGEGKYVLSYCYDVNTYGHDEDINCGKAATLYIDRTVSVISYKLSTEATGKISRPNDLSNVSKYKSNLYVQNITDMDPYAYTVVNGKKYYLNCSALSSDEKCLNNVSEYINVWYKYNEENNPTNHIEVHDRAGNVMDVYFIVGTSMPEVTVTQDENSENSFSLTVDFLNKNNIDSFGLSYTSSKTCLTSCTNEEDIQNAIENYIRALIYLNNEASLEESDDEDPDDDPIVPTTYDFEMLVFNLSDGSGDDGVLIPSVTLNGGVYTIGEKVSYPVSEGLYEFSLADTFGNVSQAYGGIGIDEAKIDVYIANDANYNEREIDDWNSEGKMPKLASEISQGLTNVFAAIEPSTYTYSLEDTDLNNSSELNSNMYFTNKYIYVKIETSQFGISNISKANQLNNLGNYSISDGSSNVDHLSCLFQFYGDDVPVNQLDSNCTNHISYTNINSQAPNLLDDYGIYVIPSSETNMLYLVFTMEGTYNVYSYFPSEVINDDEETVAMAPCLPASKSFSIDVQAPTVNFELKCSLTSCKSTTNELVKDTVYTYYISDTNGNYYKYQNVYYELTSLNRYNLISVNNYELNESGNYVKIDDEYIEIVDANRYKTYFDQTINLGNYDLRLYLSSDVLEFGSVNRLLVVKMNGEQDFTNAYAHSKTESEYHNYMEFTASGTYIVEFADAAGNSIVYRFLIDKNAPTLQEEIKDVNDKSFTEYQQYVEVKISLREDTYIEGTGEEILNVKYWFGSAYTNSTTISFTNGYDSLTEENVCQTINSSRSGCVVSNGIFSIYFIVEINKDGDRLSGSQTLSFEASDYFGNKMSSDPIGFSFDNVSPYIYYAEDYTPIKQFGANVDSDVREETMTVAANDSLGTFRCDETTILSEMILCKDTPNISGISNNTVISAYEAYRVARNNYRYFNGNYIAISDGTYVDVSENIYSRDYTFYKSEDSLVTAKNDADTKIYTRGGYRATYTNENVDPNVTYYYDNSGTMTAVSISDLYSNASIYEACVVDFSDPTCTISEKGLALYNIYVNYGYFDATRDGITFYLYSATKYYTEVADKNSINTANYSSYYYANGQYTLVSFENSEYLKAVTQENSCVILNSICMSVSKNRIKVDGYTYYSIVNITNADKNALDNAEITKITSVSLNTAGNIAYGILDDNIWRIAIDKNGNEVYFGFSFSSELGRPIIFKASDGAGNIGNNLLENVIIIKDTTAPVFEVKTISFVESASGNYKKQINYYKFNYTGEERLCNSGYTYYTDSNGNNEIDCVNMLENTDYYVAINEYVLVNDNSAPGTYYSATTSEVITDNNYLTYDNFVVSYNEPIKKVKCTYDIYVGTDKIATKECTFNNTEYEYRDSKKDFVIFYDASGSYYINYAITVYDFSDNITELDYLFIDREKPLIDFAEEVEDTEEIEVIYDGTNIKYTTYDADYAASGYSSEIISNDKINSLINSTPSFRLNIVNTFTYNVKFYKFNYNKTYKNYINNGSGFVSVEDGLTKDEETVYYTLIKKSDSYILRGNSGTCIDDNYCYIVDQYNYYPSLSTNSDYWEEVNFIRNDTIAVYKIEYKVTDYSGNVSDTLIKQIYIVDTVAPIININEEDVSTEIGYYGNANIFVDNEYQGLYIGYKCGGDNANTCNFPSDIFQTAEGITKEESTFSAKIELTRQYDGIYKFYFIDLGTYVDSYICNDISNCLENEESVKTLKYNYSQYLMKIDTKSPDLYIVASTDEDGNMYYEAKLYQEEFLYCVREDRLSNNIVFDENNLSMCRDLGFVNGERSIDYVDDKYVFTITNSKGELVYKETYKKVNASENKYFYNTYYYISNGSFVAYSVNTEYNSENEENVYLIDSISIFFREDGKYLVRAVDKAGNKTGRINSTINSKDTNSSYFVLDNTKPNYNNRDYNATGSNYWYSVPKSVVIGEDKASLVSSILGTTRDTSYYNIKKIDALNNDYFYAFSTKKDAYTYLYNIYEEDINSTNATCSLGGQSGFKYSYYSMNVKGVVETCFIGEGGLTAKEKALNEIKSSFSTSGLIFTTYSEDLLFDNSYIQQRTCEEENDNCIVDSNMYKYVYLVFTSGNDTPSIENSCTATGADDYCVRINVQIRKKTNETEFSIEFGGDSTKDTSKVYVYNNSGATVTAKNYTDSFTLNTGIIADTYYLFEERDATITYTSIDRGSTATTLSHYNVTYYGVYIDDASAVQDLYYKDIRGSVETSGTDTLSVNTGTIYNTNADIYYLVLKKNGISETEFNRRYEILKTIDGSNICVSSYMRLTINGTYKNINDYLIINGNDYYFEIPVVRETLNIIVFEDRAGNLSTIKVSQSQIAPTISVVYSNVEDLSEQTATVEILDTSLVATDSSSIEILFSTDGVNYSSTITSNILAAMKCTPNLSGNASLVYGCSNVGTVNGKNSYKVIISNKEDLYGFFRFNLTDDHGNSNSIDFIYNPADLSASYKENNTNEGYVTKYMDATMSSTKYRAINNDRLEISWDNEFNYIIFYSVSFDLSNKEVLTKVCDTKSISALDENSCMNTIYEATITSNIVGGRNITTMKYEKEGTYKAKIYNRESEVINSYCTENGCTNIETNNNISILSEDILIKDNYYRFEIDKTAPNFGISNISVKIPSGNVEYVQGSTYVNGEVSATWNEDYLRVVSSFVDIESGQITNNMSDARANTKEVYFKINNTQKSTRMTFYLEDYAGNKTIDYTFTIEASLPEIRVYELDENNVLTDKEVLDGAVVTNDVRLLCYENSIIANCSIYTVVLQKVEGEVYSDVDLGSDKTIAKIDINLERKYAFIVYVKDSAGNKYDYLKTTIVFTIDKMPPTIEITGNKDSNIGFYKGNVTVGLRTKNAEDKFSVYECVVTGIDENGDKTSTCDENTVVNLNGDMSHTISKSGYYKIIAKDKYGNVSNSSGTLSNSVTADGLTKTTGNRIMYITVDNNAPTISVVARNEYLDYKIGENAFTNAEKIVITSSDNNEGSYIKYRVKKNKAGYGEWKTVSGSTFEIIKSTENEGMYEVVPVDVVGNEGMAKHFIVYYSGITYGSSTSSDGPTFGVYYSSSASLISSKGIVDSEVFISWNEPSNEVKAPIVKVMLNDTPYTYRTVIKDPGEYVVYLVDLAGNSYTYKFAINTKEEICINDVKLTPKYQQIIKANKVGEEGSYSYTIELITGDFDTSDKLDSLRYKMQKGDVLVLATPSTGYGVNAACSSAAGVMCYKTINTLEYIEVSDSVVNYINKNGKVTYTITEKFYNEITALGGVYVFIVDEDVAKKDLGFEIGENFFTKDPIGWTMLFISAIGVIGVGIKLVFFRKKVKVL